MLDEQISNFKQKLREQIELAKDQKTVGDFDNIIYDFVEIIENDPIFHDFISCKLHMDWELENNFYDKYEQEEAQNRDRDRVFEMHIKNSFWNKFYNNFKSIHDIINLEKCETLGIELKDTYSWHIDYLKSDELRTNYRERVKTYGEKLSPDNIKKFILYFEKFYNALVGLINKNHNLLAIIYNNDIQAKQRTIKQSNKLDFDKKKSELTVKGITIKIRLKNKLPIDHYILEALFENEFWPEEVYFKDIAIDRLKYIQYDSQNDWRIFYRACQHLNEKIKKATKNEILDFVVPRTGRKAGVTINDKYLVKSKK